MAFDQALVAGQPYQEVVAEAGFGSLLARRLARCNYGFGKVILTEQKGGKNEGSDNSRKSKSRRANGKGSQGIP